MASLHSYDCVVESVMCEPLVALNACVPQRRILVATEREHRLVHLLGIEHTFGRTSRWKSVTVKPVTVRNKSGSSFVITSCSVFSRKSVRYMNAGMRVANLISFSWTSLRLAEFTKPTVHSHARRRLDRRTDHSEAQFGQDFHCGRRVGVRPEYSQRHKQNAIYSAF